MEKVLTRWAVDPTHSELAFSVRHMMMTRVKGEFTNFNIAVAGGEIVQSPVKVHIEAASIDTNNEGRDDHLKSADFFDVENYPEITFEGNSWRRKAHGEYELIGTLTIKGISKPVELDVAFGGIHMDPWGNEKAGFSIEGKINRQDWGLTWNAALETGGVLVSDEVKISGEIQFIKQS
ncbi:MAG TPA: YceI family protein [Cyclobacteriaceae bacterium]|nr:YceI family protein [Cyclobacteriaceae bacterium]